MIRKIGILLGFLFCGSVALAQTFGSPSITNAPITYGSIANTAAQGNDSRIAYYTPQMMPGCASAGSGSDDSACINAAITAASASSGPLAGEVFFPYPSSGDYNVCASTITLPVSSSIILRGIGHGDVIRILPSCGSPPSSVISQGTSYSYTASIKDLTIDGYCLAAHDINLTWAYGFTLTDVVLRNVATSGSNLYVQAGGQDVFDASNLIQNVNDTGHTCYASASALPLYGVQTLGTDSNYGLVVENAQTAYFYSGGGNNRFIGAHGWGQTVAQVGIDLRAPYAFQSLGQNYFIGTAADGFTVAGYFLQAASGGGTFSGAVVSGVKLEGSNTTGAAGVLLDTGVTGAVVVGNELSGISSPSTYAITTVSGSIDPSNVIIGNSYDGSSTSMSNISVGPLTGDQANITGSGISGSGATIQTMSASSNAPLVLQSKGTSQVFLRTGGGNNTGFTVYAPASTANYISANGAVAGSAPYLQAAGSDTNISLGLLTKGTGVVQLKAGFVSSGTTFTISGCSATSATGGAQAGSFISGTTGTCSVTITINGATGASTTHAWNGIAWDVSTPTVVVGSTSNSTTTISFSLTTTSGDTIRFTSMGE